ncbi:MAG TPA: hypothetical protein P5299_01520 [Candidatus Woesebacteria bacterium]|nr:hypothetical protein [Candidatus Woesebacteria bacterium]HRT40025.1 hypothetical protein [Candidatus Woesebacteria bacterium]
MQIIPTVLEKEFNAAEKTIRQVMTFSPWIQIDVIDGIYTQGKTFELELLNKAEFPETILWDIHLMVKEPENWLEKCFFVGAARITGQVEMMTDRYRFINKIKSMNIEAGLAFDQNTPATNIPPETNLVLLMGRKAGFIKNKFDPQVLKKINHQFITAIDGGVSSRNIKTIEEAGVDIVYSGRAFRDLINHHAGQNSKNN